MAKATVGGQVAVIALVGNPNCGKTSLFNVLTSSNQKVGNYPGVTVERAVGHTKIGDWTAQVIDVPGLYSMRPVSLDEEVATAEIRGAAHEGPPDVLVCVLDASNLERSLFFFSQMIGSQVPTVVAVTMNDVLLAEGGSIDMSALAGSLGVEVVPVVAHKGQGLAELRQAIDRALVSKTRPEVDLGFPNVVREPVFRLHERLARAGIDVTKSAVREALLDPNAPLNARLCNNPEFVAEFEAEREAILGDSAQGKTLDAQARYAWAARVRREVLVEPEHAKARASDKIDRILTHRFWGLIAFVATMYLVFQSIYTLATPIMGWIDSLTQAAAAAVGPRFAATPVLQSLVVDGVITGLGSVLQFLPQILILFFFIAVLEGSGYLARAAFLMDRLFGWAGLNGRAFIPLLSSFACAVPGIMAARVMPDHRSRLVTILAAPLMSCSARLPVYILFIGTFIEPKFGPGAAGLALFVMHFVGLGVAVPMVWLLNRSLFKARRLPFVLELPRYHWPRWRDVRLTMLSRAKVFLQTAGTIIFALSIVIWALLYFPRSPQADAAYRADYVRTQTQASEENYVAARRISDSYLGRFGHAIEPAFVPAGFDWRLTTAVLAAFPAREVVVSAMGIIFDLGAETDENSKGLRSSLASARWPDGRPLITLASACSLMVFFALCCQCMATLATIKRETGTWKWAAFAFATMTLVAYGAAVAVYQVLSRMVPV